MLTSSISTCAALQAAKEEHAEALDAMVAQVEKRDRELRTIKATASAIELKQMARIAQLRKVLEVMAADPAAAAVAAPPSFVVQRSLKRGAPESASAAKAPVSRRRIDAPTLRFEHVKTKLLAVSAAASSAGAAPAAALSFTTATVASAAPPTLVVASALRADGLVELISPGAVDCPRIFADAGDAIESIVFLPAAACVAVTSAVSDDDAAKRAQVRLFALDASSPRARGAVTTLLEHKDASDGGFFPVLQLASLHGGATLAVTTTECLVCWSVDAISAAPHCKFECAPPAAKPTRRVQAKRKIDSAALDERSAVRTLLACCCEEYLSLPECALELWTLDTIAAAAPCANEPGALAIASGKGFGIIDVEHKNVGEPGSVVNDTRSSLRFFESCRRGEGEPSSADDVVELLQVTSATLVVRRADGSLGFRCARSKTARCVDVALPPARAPRAAPPQRGTLAVLDATRLLVGDGACVHVVAIHERRVLQTIALAADGAGAALACCAAIVRLNARLVAFGCVSAAAVAARDAQSASSAEESSGTRTLSVQLWSSAQ